MEKRHTTKIAVCLISSVITHSVARLFYHTAYSKGNILLREVILNVFNTATTYNP